MRVDDVRASNDSRQGGRDWMGGVAAHPADGSQRSNAQSVAVAQSTRNPAERDQLAFDLPGPGKSASQLERVAFPSAE
jgi:hypothetical protein